MENRDFISKDMIILFNFCIPSVSPVGRFSPDVIPLCFHTDVMLEKGHRGPADSDYMVGNVQCAGCNHRRPVGAVRHMARQHVISQSELRGPLNIKF